MVLPIACDDILPPRFGDETLMNRQSKHRKLSVCFRNILIALLTSSVCQSFSRQWLGRGQKEEKSPE